MSTEPVAIVVTGAATVVATVVAAVSSDPNVIAGAVILILASATTMAVQIINARSASRDRREAAAERLYHLELAAKTSALVEDTSKKTDEIVKSTGQIHELTNSTSSNLQSALNVMAQKVAGLEQVITELRAAKVDTAAAQALVDQRTALKTPTDSKPE